MATPDTPKSSTTMPKELFVLMHIHCKRDRETFRGIFNAFPISVHLHEEEALECMLSKPPPNMWPCIHRGAVPRIVALGREPLHTIWIRRPLNPNEYFMLIWWIEKAPYSDGSPEKNLESVLEQFDSLNIRQEDEMVPMPGE